MIGLSNLLKGDLDEAETYLQLSSRWAQTPQQQVASAANLGALQWYKLADDSAQEKFSIWQHRINSFQSDPKKVGISKETPKSLLSTAVGQAVVQHALLCWNDAVQDLQQVSSSSTGAGAGAAMCGPGGGLGSLGGPGGPGGMTMTGLTDQDIRAIRGKIDGDHAQHAKERSSGGGQSSILAENLSNVSTSPALSPEKMTFFHEPL